MFLIFQRVTAVKVKIVINNQKQPSNCYLLAIVLATYNCLNEGLLVNFIFYVITVLVCFDKMNES